jgi:hypothetical protein
MCVNAQNVITHRAYGSTDWAGLALFFGYPVSPCFVEDGMSAVVGLWGASGDADCTACYEDCGFVSSAEDFLLGAASFLRDQFEGGFATALDYGEQALDATVECLESGWNCMMDYVGRDYLEYGERAYGWAEEQVGEAGSWAEENVLEPVGEFLEDAYDTFTDPDTYNPLNWWRHRRMNIFSDMKDFVLDLDFDCQIRRLGCETYQMAFEGFTDTVQSLCMGETNPNRKAYQDRLEESVDLLTAAMAAANPATVAGLQEMRAIDIDEVKIRFCWALDATGTAGMAPSPNLILLGFKTMKDYCPVDLAQLLAHELFHIHQYRDFGGEGNFNCRYTHEICDGNRWTYETGNQIEVEATNFEMSLDYCPNFTCPAGTVFKWTGRNGYPCYCSVEKDCMNATSAVLPTPMPTSAPVLMPTAIAQPTVVQPTPGPSNGRDTTGLLNNMHCTVQCTAQCMDSHNGSEISGVHPPKPPKKNVKHASKNMTDSKTATTPSTTLQRIYVGESRLWSLVGFSMLLLGAVLVGIAIAVVANGMRVWKQDNGGKVVEDPFPATGADVASDQVYVHAPP